MSKYETHIRLVTQAFRAAKRERDAYRQMYEKALKASPVPKHLVEHIFLKMGNRKCLLAPIHRLGLYPHPLSFFSFLQSQKTIEHLIFGISHEDENLFHGNVEPEKNESVPKNKRHPQRLVDILVHHSASLKELSYLVSVRRKKTTGLYPITQQEQEQWELSLGVIRAPREGFDEIFNQIITGR